jgi:predicted glycosyltransferase
MKIWIDFDNTPHVPFFKPIIRELERRGFKVVITARDAYQVYELADKMNLQYIKIGRHYGKSAVKKLLGLVWRAFQLAPFCLRERPDLALSHGSRSQGLLSNLLRIPSVIVFDYEHARNILIARARWLIAPEALSGENKLSKIKRIRFYRGIKEDVYVPQFKPDPALLEELGICGGEILMTVRPPAAAAHYYNPESDKLLLELMSRICQTPGIRVILLPRNHLQELAFKANYPSWFIEDKTIVPAKAVDGLNLLWLSDLVVSGGGTMNREAAALGVPVYSIFMGKTGAVDKMLEKEYRLTLIRSVEDIWTKIRFVKRDKSQTPNNQPRAALEDIVNYIEEILRVERVQTRRA